MQMQTPELLESLEKLSEYPYPLSSLPPSKDRNPCPHLMVHLITLHLLL